MTRIEALGTWPARVAWVLVALVSTSTFDAALAGRSSGVVVALGLLLACCWAIGLVALLVERSASLTALRVVVPAGAAAVTWAVAAGGSITVLDVASLLLSGVAVVWVFAPWVSEAYVDGSAYGPEQRTPLRTPVLLLPAAPISWAFAVAGVAAGPLLLGAGRWVAGALALAVGWPVAYAAIRSIHQLARRWVVIVPAGLVLHDPLTMPEPQLFLKHSIHHVGPAAADDPETVTEDLTAGAAGLALELVLDEPVELLLRAGRGQTTTRTVERVVFVPARPLTVLGSRRERRITVT